MIEGQITVLIRNSVILLSASILLASCNSSKKPWVKSDVRQSEAEQAMAECNYQAEAATITIGSGGGHYKSYGSAIEAGIANGIEQELDREKLVGDCMKAKGFSQ
ncbi:hypothetical protein O9X90_23405 [Agrobacterium leguminum]|uniref:hypothetical protein n=1 Tax=Agrobacterium leguminum TaxID=2792015 RepID=UPI0022B81EDA|nr:hypothetical protein [Agrobacterium leguminum]MCZ7935281.1 hypothetical protein [Agrobacterium leguminum]